MKRITYVDFNDRPVEAPDGVVPEVRVSAYGVAIHLGDVLMVRGESELWGLPGGRLEPGETFADCVLREGLEEAGHPLRCLSDQPSYLAPQVGFHWHVTDRWFWTVRLFFACEAGVAVEDFVPPEDEVQEVEWIPLWRLRDTPMSTDTRMAISRVRYPR